MPGVGACPDKGGLAGSAACCCCLTVLGWPCWRAGLRLVELSSGAQLPASLKHAAVGAVLGVHIAEEAHAVSRHGRDAVVLKACLAGRLASIRRLSAAGLGRGALNCVAQMPELRRLCLLAGERRRLELGLELPELEVLRVEGYQIIEVGAAGGGVPGHRGGCCARSAVAAQVFGGSSSAALARALARSWPPCSLPCPPGSRPAVAFPSLCARSCACRCASSCTPPCWPGTACAARWRCRPRSARWCCST